MKEVKEKLTSLTASAEKSTQEGWQKELLTKKKLLRATLFSWVHNAAHVHDNGNRWMSANTAYFTSLRAHPSHYWHWFYMKILCNVWDATESEILPLATSRI